MRRPANENETAALRRDARSRGDRRVKREKIRLDRETWGLWRRSMRLVLISEVGSRMKLLGGALLVLL